MKGFLTSTRFSGKARYYIEEKNDLAQTLGLLAESNQLDSTNEETVWVLGTVQGRGGNIAEAIRWHSKFTELRPNDPAAWAGLEWAYKLAGNEAKAAECRAKGAGLK